MVMVVVTPMMSSAVVCRLRLRGHWGQQEQQKGSEEKLFHVLRIPSANEMHDNPPTPKVRRVHIQ